MTHTEKDRVSVVYQTTHTKPTGPQHDVRERYCFVNDLRERYCFVND